MNIKTSEIEIMIKELEASRNHLPNRYLQSKILNILQKLIIKKDKENGLTFNKMEHLINKQKEPYHYQNANLIDQNSLHIILNAYDELIEILKLQLNKK